MSSGNEEGGSNNARKRQRTGKGAKEKRRQKRAGLQGQHGKPTGVKAE